MARPFSEIAASPEFQAETPETQEAIKQDYFNKVIRPQVEAAGDNPDEVFNDFSSKYTVTQPAQPEPVQQEEPVVADRQPSPQEQQAAAMVQNYLNKPADTGYNLASSGSAPQETNAGILGSIKNAITGGDAVTGSAANLPLAGEAPEFFGNGVGEELKDGDALDQMLNWAGNRLGGIATNMFGGDESIIKRAESRGGKVSQDEQGNTIITFPSGQYQVNKPGLDLNDVAKFTAQAAPAVATGGAGAALGLGGRMVAQGAIQGGLNYAQQKAVEAGDGQNVDMGDVALNATLGGAGELLGPALRGGKAVFSKGLGNADEATKEALKIADEAGIPIATSDMIAAGDMGGGVTKYASAVTDKLDPFASGRLRKQELIPEKTADIFVDPEVAAKYSDEAMIEALDKGSKARIADAGKRFEEVKSEMGDTPIPVRNTSAAIDDVLKEWERPGTLVDKGDIEYLKDIQAKLTEAPQDVIMLRENRTRLRNSFGSGMNKMMGKNDLEKAGRKIYEALTKDMHEGVEGTLGADALATLKSADKDWASINSDLGFQKIATAVKKGEADPARLRETLASFGTGDLKALDRNLNKDGRDMIKAAVHQNLMDAAKNADGEFQPGAMLRAIEKNKDVINQFYTPDQAKQIEGVKKLLSTARGAKAATTIANNGGLMLPISAALGVGSAGVGGIAAAAGGIAAKRLSNSRPMRNALIRLSTMKPGSMQYYRTVRQINAIIANQTSTDE